MECDRCGAERPRTGPCPECGAPPPPPYSSSRGRSQPGSTSGGPRRSSGTNWGNTSSPGSSGGRGLLSRGGANGDGWGDWNEPPRGSSRPGMSSPGGRPSSPGYGTHGYDPDSDSRALVPQYGQAMPPAAEDEIVSIPGFPMTDEEERASGIRRPAYIPATEEKRKRKLSSWRIVSGVLSVMLVCVASCAGAGFFGQQAITHLVPAPLRSLLQPQKVDLSQIPVTPVATAGPASKNITSIVTAQGVDGNYNPENVTSIFLVKSTVYVVMTFVGVSQNQNDNFSCQWYLNNINFNLKENTTKDVSSLKTTNFHAYCALQYNQVGVGEVRIYWNRPASDTSESAKDPYLAQTIKFGIVTQIPGSPTPGTPGAGSPTPKASAPNAGQAVAWRETRSDS